MRTTFVKTLIGLAERDDRIFLITPDMGFSVFEPFIELYPDRFLNVGIAEQNATGVAAGLALSGFKVYLYSIVPFVTMRNFEQVRVDIAYMGTNVKIIGVGGGLSYGPAGATHHAIEDVALMRSLPGMSVCCPGDPIEVERLLRETAGMSTPAYFRLGKNNEPAIHEKDDEIVFGKISILREGAEFAVLAMGNVLEMVGGWVKGWVSEGCNPLFASCHTMKPFDEGFIRQLVKDKVPILTVEEHNSIGGLGSVVAEIVGRSGSSTRILSIAISDHFSHLVGSQEYLRTNFGIKRPSLDQILGQGE